MEFKHVVKSFTIKGPGGVAEALKELRKPEYHDELRLKNIEYAKILVSQSVTHDNYIIQAINSIEELDRIINTMVKRLREWFGYYFPEISKAIPDNEQFVKRIIQKTKAELMQEHGWELSMGPEIIELDLNAIMNFARHIENTYYQREATFQYLDALIKLHYPNIHALAGSIISAKLIERAGSMRALIMLPSSTIQVLGAEQALFRHLRNKSNRPPKHGLILSHPLVMDARRDERGASARALAAKISIAAKVDYFKGEFIGDKLREELEKRR